MLALSVRRPRRAANRCVFGLTSCILAPLRGNQKKPPKKTVASLQAVGPDLFVGATALEYLSLMNNRIDVISSGFLMGCGNFHFVLFYFGLISHVFAVWRARLRTLEFKVEFKLYLSRC